ncbi:MAG: hypothetical protein WCG27_08865 [Pseudomonadota bacterium]
MRSIIETIVTIAVLLAFGNHFSKKFYYYVQKETIIRVHRGLGSLSNFTEKLTAEDSSLKHSRE